MQKNIVLISPPIPNYDYLKAGYDYPPIQVILLATILKQNGFKVDVIDGFAAFDWFHKAMECVKSDTLFVGISAMTFQLPAALAISNSIKDKFTSIPIVWGGIHPSLFPEQTVRHHSIDIIVYNEGAETILELAHCLARGDSFSSIKGIFYKENNSILRTQKREPDNIRGYPVLDYNFIDINLYANNSWCAKLIESIDKKKHRALPIITGLGCNFKCSFCITQNLRRPYRFLSAERLIEQIIFMMQTYDIDTLVIMDENFTHSRDRLVNFLDLIEEKKISFHWVRINSRANYFKKDFLDLSILKRMEELGAQFIQIGIESGARRIRNEVLNKSINDEHINRCCEYLGRTNIISRFFFMGGIPTEQKDELHETCRLIARMAKNMGHNFAPDLFIYRPWPGGELYRHVIEKSLFKQPKSIEDWASYIEKPSQFENGESFINSPLEHLIKIIRFYFTFLMFETRLIFKKRNNFMKLLFTIMRKLSYLRFKFCFFYLPIELYLYRGVKRIGILKKGKVL